jgi:hypothetical protein
LPTIIIIAFRVQIFNVNHINPYLSPTSGQSNSALCKLSEIAHILDAAYVLARLPFPGHPTIVDKVFALINLHSHQDDANASNLYATGSILNSQSQRPARESHLIAQKRRNDFMVEVNRGGINLNGFSRRK